jgi:hypothetical protein
VNSVTQAVIEVRDWGIVMAVLTAVNSLLLFGIIVVLLTSKRSPEERWDPTSRQWARWDSNSKAWYPIR